MAATGVSLAALKAGYRDATIAVTMTATEEITVYFGLNVV
jgi:hypothetical protein